MIEVKNLTKLYGDNRAVSDLSFRVETGEIVGFLGPNGAGKTTTMNIMTGCLAASEGTVTIDGLDIFEDAAAAKRKIGYLPELPPLYLDMTPNEYLRFVARAKGVKGPDVEKQVTHVMRVTGTHGVKDRLIKNLSKGYRQRVGIAEAILGDPEIIILDEPTVGLDPKQIIEIRELIKELGKSHTVILSSHILSEVQEVCSRIIIISHGRMVANDVPEKLEEKLTGERKITLTVKAPEEEALAIARSVGETAEALPEKEAGYTVLSVALRGEEDLREALFFAFAAKNLPIVEMTTVHSSLEDIFLELTGSKQEVAAKTAAHRVRSEDGETAEAPSENGTNEKKEEGEEA